MGKFGFKAFYEIYKEALLDGNQTSAVASLFAPILRLKKFPNKPNDKDDTTELKIDSKRASEWVNASKRSVRSDVAKFAQSVTCQDKIVEHFENVIVPDELDDFELDSLVEEMLECAIRSSLDQKKKNELQRLLKDQETGEFLAKAFIFSLAEEIPSKKKKTTKLSSKAVLEFDEKVIKRHKKPQTIVPKEIDDSELGYVNALLEAYEEATGSDFKEPNDVKGTEYEEHFRQQRKNYYQAETIHRATRDSISLDEEDFDVLKEEIEDGIYSVAHAKYARGIDKAESVLDAAGRMPISINLDNNTFGWVGPGERRGVCHMLVNDHKLKWVEDKDDGE